ncbi:MAG: hypothetical protein ACODAC_04330 [Pseudomonadota bacterium]
MRGVDLDHEVGMLSESALDMAKDARCGLPMTFEVDSGDPSEISLDESARAAHERKWSRLAERIADEMGERVGSWGC